MENGNKTIQFKIKNSKRKINQRKEKKKNDLLQGIYIYIMQKGLKSKIN